MPLAESVSSVEVMSQRAARLPCASSDTSFHFSQVAMRSAYSRLIIGSPASPKNTRSGGSAASTIRNSADAVAFGSPGVDAVRMLASEARAASATGVQHLFARCDAGLVGKEAVGVEQRLVVGLGRNVPDAIMQRVCVAAP
jgi:hypothetical protein